MRIKAHLPLCVAAILATCGAAQGQLVISQIYGGGGATTGSPAWAHDWVEIYNRGAASVSLTGYSVQYASTTGTTWTVQAIDTGTVTSLNPGQYLLVRLGRGTGTVLGPDLTTQDVAGPASGTGVINMSATAGKVALVNSTTALIGAAPVSASIIDVVGYGSGTNFFEGTSPASATGLNTTTSLVRLLNGCFDTDRNNFDVGIGTASPRNSATTVATCPAVAGDLTVSTTALTTCDIGPAGSAVSYTYNVTNNTGAAIDATMSVTIPGNLTFSGSVPAGTLVGSVVTIPVGSVAPGSPVAVTVNVAANSIGAGPAASVAVSGGGVDANPGNNGPVTGTSVFVAGATPVAAQVLLVVTDPAGSLASLSSDVPGLPGTKFLWGPPSTEWFSRMFPSDNGSRWIARARTSAGATADDVLLIYNTATNTFTLAAQQGVEFLAGSGVLVGDIDQTPGINNAGDFVFSTTPTGASTQQVVYKSVGGTPSVVAQPGTSNVLLTGTANLYANTNSSIGITNAGAASFHTNTGATAATTGTAQDAVFTNDGSTLLAREGTVALGTGTVPGNQAGATTWQFLTLQSGSTQDTAPYISGDGVNSVLQGSIDAPTGTDPEVVVVNGNVVVQGGVTPVGSTTVAIAGVLSSTGAGTNWIATGTGTAGTLDWVLRNGTLVGIEGTPAVTGGTDLLESTFGAAALNSLNDWAYTGFLSAPTDYDDVVLVVNGDRVLLRENDPIDLDADGSVDGYVRLFRNSRMAITADRKLFIVVEVGGGTQPCGTAQRTKIADVLLRFDLSSGSTLVCCRGVTCTTVPSAGACTAPAGVGVRLLPISVGSCTGQAASNTGCCYADFNKSGVKDVADIFAFLSAWFANSPFSDVGGDGTGTRDVSDIFQFLSAWFAGCV